MTDEELKAAAEASRQKIHRSRIGTMHAMWEAVFDAEAHLAGEQAICSRQVVENELAKFLADE